MRDHLYSQSIPSLPLPSHPNMLRLSHHTCCMAAAASSDFLNLIHLECCRRKRYLIFLTHCDPQRTESQKQKLCDVITQSESQWCYICWRYVTHLCQPRFNTCPLSVFSFIFSSIYCVSCLLTAFPSLSVINSRLSFSKTKTSPWAQKTYHAAH